MGQAKQRGTREERVAAALERNRVEAEARNAQRRAQKLIWEAAGRSGLLGQPERRTRRVPALLADALASVEAP